MVLTGPPAVGKTTAGRALAASRRQGAYVDVDDIRQLVVAEHAAPWDGPEGIHQQLFGERDESLLAREFGAPGLSMIADVVIPRTLAVYRSCCPDVSSQPPGHTGRSAPMGSDPAGT